MDLRLSEEQKLAVATLRRFVRKEIWLWEKRIDSDAVTLPSEAWTDLLAKSQASGLADLVTAPGCCEPDLDEALPDLLTRARVAEEMSQHRAGVVSPSYELFGVDAPPQLYAAKEDQQERFLWPLLRREARAFVGLSDPTGAGQPMDGTRIRARRISNGGGVGGWMLDGTKLFVVGAETADFGLIFANTEDEDGAALGVSLFVVESTREGLQRWRPYRTLSRGQDVMELNLSNLRLPAENLIGELGGGATMGEPFLTRRRVFQAAQLTGVASAAQDMARRQAHERREFDTPIAAQQGAQWALADNEVELRASRWLYLAAAQALDSSEAGATAGVAGARLVAGSAATTIIDRTIQLHGSAGISADLPLERWYRDLRLRRIDEGGEATQRSTIAAHLLTTFKK